MSTVDKTLNERGSRYGAFEDNAEITQRLKHVMRRHPGWGDLDLSQAEALEMIAHKIGRILNGDPNYIDSWHDIAGYACLVEKSLQGAQTEKPTAPTKKPDESLGAFISRFVRDDNAAASSTARKLMDELKTMFPESSISVTFASEESGLID